MPHGWQGDIAVSPTYLDPLPDPQSSDLLGAVFIGGVCYAVVRHINATNITAENNPDCYWYTKADGTETYVSEACPGYRGGWPVALCSQPPGPGDESPDTTDGMPVIPPSLPAGCCDNLADALQSIADALQELKQPCEKDVFDCSKITDECLDKIVNAVIDKLNKPVKSCADCCDELSRGIALNSEDALTCAQCSCEESKQECSIAGLQPGERCPKCDKEPCCCTKDYTCEPCEEEPKPKKFVGWCNVLTGSTIVLDEGNSPPSPAIQWQQASLSDSESVALQQAIAYCQKKPQQPPPTEFPYINPRLIGSKCDLATFANPTLVRQLIGGSAQTLNTVTAEEILRAGIDTLVGLIPGEGIIQQLIAPLKSVAYGPIASAARLAESFGKAIGCDDHAFNAGFVALSMLSLVGKYTGVNTEEFATPIINSLNSICRRKHLDPDKAVAAWLANAIDASQLDTLWAMQGYCPEALQYYREAARSKPLPNDLATMRFRGLIDEGNYHLKMRQLGYIDEHDRINLYESRKPLPTLSDIVRFMVRDADDTGPGGVVQRFQLDDYFEQKYAKQLRRWSEQQGIDPTIAQYAWRSHWEIPSPGQLFEFYRRLRHKPGFENILDDVKAALVQQDILPFWHKAYFEVLHPPLTRVDVRRAFDIGEFDEKQVYDAHIDLGYSDTNAEKLTKFASRLRFLGLLNHLFIRGWVSGKLTGEQAKQKLRDFGYPDELIARAMVEGSRNFDRSPEAKAFIRGEISADKLREILLGDGVTIEVVDNLLGNLSYQAKWPETTILYTAGTISYDEALRRLTQYGIAEARAITQLNEIDARIDAEGASRCRRAISLRVKSGELTPDEAFAAFVQVGITPERAAKLTNWLKCFAGVASKSIPTGKLCELMGQGAVNGAEFVDRLKRLGYDDHDTNLLLFDCTARLNVRQQQLARKQAQEQAREQQKLQQQLDKAAAQVNRLRAEQERARKAAVATRTGRQKQLMSAADKLLKKCDCTVADAVSFATATRDSLRDKYGLTIDESLQALLLAVEAWDGETLDTLTEIAESNAQLAVDSALNTSVNGSNGSFS